MAEPDVPSDNNPAERSLRHVVISRKVSGGTRSERGTESKMTLASVFGTWRARSLNPLAACRLPPTAHFPSNLSSYMQSRWLCGSIFWVLLVWGSFGVSKTIIPEALPYLFRTLRRSSFRWIGAKRVQHDEQYDWFFCKCFRSFWESQSPADH